MRQFILSLLACLCLTAYSQTASQADLLVEEAQKLESKQDYPTAITKLKQADELYVKTGKTQSAERATCLHILGRCYLNLERPEGLTYTQMAADMRKTILGETNIKYISSLNNTGLYYLTVAKDYPKAAEIHSKTWELCPSRTGIHVSYQSRPLLHSFRRNGQSKCHRRRGNSHQ